MATFTASVGAYGNYQLELDLNLVSQNIAGNYSTVSYAYRVRRVSGSTGTYGSTSSWFLDVSGLARQQWDIPYDFRTAGAVLNIASGQFNLAHHSDGTAVLSSNGYWPHISTGMQSTIVSGSIGLPTIPRASTASVSPHPLTAGAASTITITRADAGFTHKLEYHFGTVKAIIAENVATSVAWTPPLSLLNEMPGTTSGNGTLTVTTFSGSTQIGTWDTGITIQAGPEIVPTFTTVTHSEATAGVAASIGAYVQGISKLNLALTGAAGVYGSTITAYKLEAAGQVLNAASGVTPATIATSGTVPIVGTITDSRGRTATKTVNATVLAYAPPTITSVTIQRALSGGTVNDDGTYLRVNINASVKSLMVNAVEKNTLTYRISTRAYGTTAWTLRDTVTPTGIAFNSFKVATGTYPIEQSFEVLVEIYDKFVTSAVQNTVPTAAIFMHWDAALGMGLGKYRQNGMLDVLGDIYHRNGSLVEPSGNITATARTTAPPGWLICDGAAVSRTTYAALYTAIGTRFGTGDGTTTFNLPNLKGRVIAGVDATQTEFDVSGEVGGAKTHTLSINEMPAHDHDFNGHTYSWGALGNISFTNNPEAKAGAAVGNGLHTYQDTDGWSDTLAKGGGTAHNNLQPYMAMHYIIKT